MEESFDDEYEADVRHAKLARKKSKKLKDQSSQEHSDRILNSYLRTIQDKSNDGDRSDANNSNKSLTNDTDDDDFATSRVLFDNAHSSTVLRDITNRGLEARKKSWDPLSPSNINNNLQDKNHSHSNCSAAIKAYKMQTSFFKTKYNEAKVEAQKWKAEYENLVKQTSTQSNLTTTQSKLTSTQSDCSLLIYYDKLYTYDGPFEITEESESIKLLNNVECKKIAYKEAFKSSKPIQAIKKLMYGIYGYEDLVKRSLKDEQIGEFQPLNKNRSEAIERELYRFLRLNSYNVQLIKLELQEINKYYHNAISSAKLKYKRQKAAEEALKELEKQAQEGAELLL